MATEGVEIMFDSIMVSYALNNLLAILWIFLFLKSKRESGVQITHFLFLIFAIGILINSLYSAAQIF
jgi:heme/copper-type cytochrome/quinol oxidase subunit 4